MQTNLTAAAHAALAAHGVPQPIIDMVSIEALPALHDGQPERGLLSFIARRDGRRIITAEINAHSVADAMSHLEDRAKAATFIALGVSGIPAEIRPELPEWISEASQADAVIDSLNRARRLAKAATGGQDAATPAPAGADLPF